MSGFRGLTGNKGGQPTTLSQISNNINPSILSETQNYKRQNVNNQQPLNNIQQPQLNNPKLMNNVPKPMMLGNKPNINLVQQTSNNVNNKLLDMQKQFEQLQKKNNQIQQQQQQIKMQRNLVQNSQPQQQMIYGQQMMFQQPPPQFMNYNYQMYNNLIHQPQIQIPQKQNIIKTKETKSEESKEKENISTNGTKDMKSDKEVSDELENNDEFKEDWLKNWREQYLQYANLNKNSNNPIDNLDWNSYLKDINPLIEKDTGYKFEENNPYVKENKNNNNNNEEKEDIDYFKEGVKLMNSGNLNKAVLAFEAVVKKQPNRSEAWRLLGQCHADNENEKQAIYAFKKCNELDPYDLHALLNLGVSYTNEIDPYSALKFLKEWIANHPDYSVLLNDLKSNKKKNDIYGYYGHQDDTEQVIKLFLKAVNINGKDVDLHVVLGVLYNLTSDFKKAEVHFKKAIQLKPKDPSLWNKLGATQANGNNSKAAIKAYSKALQLKPNYVRALSNLGISFANQNMHVKACQSYLASLKRNPSADTVWDHLIQSLMRLNRGDLITLAQKRDVTLFQKHFEF